MSITKQLAKHVRDMHFGGNWTVTNLKTVLADVTWQQAVTKVHDLNTIAALTYHINYFITVVTKVLAGGPLDGSDKVSFSHPPIESQADWDMLLQRIWQEAETFATYIEQLPNSRLDDLFLEPKYGTWYGNLGGIAEHFHYHLGQIVIIKKLVQLQGDADRQPIV